jgi:thymidylate kinase
VSRIRIETVGVLDLWVVMAGPAGSGKSTLSESLGAFVRRDGGNADVFGEDELFRRSEFTDVAEMFRTTGGPAPAVLESAYAAWVDGLPTRKLAVMDWNPAGLAGDLAWARADQRLFRAHLATIGRLTSRPIVAVDLQVPAEVAVRRAAQQRGEDWLVQYDVVARSAGHHETDRLDRVIAWTREHMARTAVELNGAASAGWSVHHVDATAPLDAVQEHVQTIVGHQPRRIVDCTASTRAGADASWSQGTLSGTPRCRPTNVEGGTEQFNQRN